MVRAPCGEKMGLKRGPWTIEEDHILISFIQKHGHPNWRALPKHAGLLRCGKSCRLRWTNYLRPDIKRGNFSKEEEDMIISLHERIGNRWSAIAAKLPGRTDNEIKNVWHTYLKKHIQPNQESSKPKKAKSGSKTVKLQKSNVDMQANSSALSFNSEISSTSGTSNSSVTTVTTVTTDRNNKSFGIQNESMDFSSQLDFEVIDESTWSEALSIMEGENGTVAHTFGHISEQSSSICSSNDEEIDYWLRIFREAGDLHNLPEL